MKFDHLVISLLVLSILAIHGSSATQIDIHLKVGENAFFLNLNEQLRRMLPNNQIDFANKATPHVTLYLTDFKNESIPMIINKTQQFVNQFGGNCFTNMTSITVQGSYAMWDVDVTPCLQKMSDLVVVALKEYITPNQPIPDWVLQLPEPMRSRKIEMIQKYGSPNVFEEFQPHVTLAYDELDQMKPVFDRLNLKPKSVIPPAIGVGLVGPFGTVLKGKDFASFALPRSPVD